MTDTDDTTTIWLPIGTVTQGFEELARIIRVGVPPLTDTPDGADQLSEADSRRFDEWVGKLAGVLIAAEAGLAEIRQEFFPAAGSETLATFFGLRVVSDRETEPQNQTSGATPPVGPHGERT
jgi:hypothetical protein